MASRPIEEHMADFLILMRDPRMKDYRRRCLAYWREHYGQAIAEKVEAMVRDRWDSKAKPPTRSF